MRKTFFTDRGREDVWFSSLCAREVWARNEKLNLISLPHRWNRRKLSFRLDLHCRWCRLCPRALPCPYSAPRCRRMSWSSLAFASRDCRPFRRQSSSPVRFTVINSFNLNYGMVGGGWGSWSLGVKRRLIAMFINYITIYGFVINIK